MKIKMGQADVPRKKPLTDDIQEAMAELKLVRGGKSRTQNARGLVDEL